MCLLSGNVVRWRKIRVCVCEMVVEVRLISEPPLHIPLQNLAASTSSCDVAAPNNLRFFSLPDIFFWKRHSFPIFLLLALSLQKDHTSIITSMFRNMQCYQDRVCYSCWFVCLFMHDTRRYYGSRVNKHCLRMRDWLGEGAPPFTLTIGWTRRSFWTGNLLCGNRKMVNKVDFDIFL